MKNTQSLENLTVEAITSIAASIAKKYGVEAAMDWLQGNFTPEEIKEVGYNLNIRIRARKG